MPFVKFHSARISDPDQYDSFAYSKDKLGPGIDVNFGIKDGKSKIQAIRFVIDKFTTASAEKWLKDHDFKPTSFEPAKTEAETFSTPTSNIAQHSKRMLMFKRKRKNTIAEQVNILLERKSHFEILKLNKVPLTIEERKKCFETKTVWHYASSKHPITGRKVGMVSAVWKAECEGKIIFITNTHRAYNTASTLEGAINRFHKFIKSTA